MPSLSMGAPRSSFECYSWRSEPTIVSLAARASRLASNRRNQVQMNSGTSHIPSAQTPQSTADSRQLSVDLILTRNSPWRKLPLIIYKADRLSLRPRRACQALLALPCYDSGHCRFQPITEFKQHQRTSAARDNLPEHIAPQTTVDVI